MLHILQHLAADKASFLLFNSSYTPIETHAQIKISIKGMEVEIKENGSEGAEVVLQRAYDRYLKMTEAVPELVPHRLPPPKPVPESEYTEYTDVPAQKNEVPF